MQNPFYAPYGNDNNCCGDAGDCTTFTGYQGWNNPNYQGWNNPAFTGFNPTFTGYQGWNNPNYQGWNASTSFASETPGFNDFANVPGPNQGTPSTTPATNTGYPGMNWTGSYATDAA